jgi:hypothetical protein
MPITATQTREDLRVSIGRILKAVKLIEADATGATTTFITDELATGAADDFNGKWLVFTSGQSNIDGQIRQVTNSTVSSNRVTLTFFPAVSNAPADAATAELWDEAYDPEDINEYIEQVTGLDASGLIFIPTEDISLHADGKTARFDIPTTLEMLRDVYVRDRVTSVEIDNCDTIWAEAAAPSNVTRVTDTEDRKRGGGSCKWIIAGAFSTGLVSSKAISSLDLSKHTHIEFWVKSTTATSAGDFTVLLDDTVNAASAIETLSIPALVADTWTYIRVALATPELDSAIISVGLNAGNNIGGNTIWLDDVKAVVNDTADWELMPRNLWMVDKQARDLVFIDSGVSWAGYGLMKLVGGDNPLRVTADSDTNEVPDSYVIYRAVGLALLTQPEQITRARMYLGMAEVEKSKFPMLVNARLLT